MLKEIKFLQKHFSNFEDERIPFHLFYEASFFMLAKPDTLSPQKKISQKRKTTNQLPDEYKYNILIKF